MVSCPTITVIQTVPDVVVTDKSFATEGLTFQFCAGLEIVGKGIQYLVAFQASAPALLNVIITRTGPDGTIVSQYIDVSLPMGATNKVFLASPSGVTYQPGTYTITFIELQNIRPA